ncbi:MAG: ABC-F family ATP-binding cassette domain-containing protein [Alkalispirochaeta sp.]
MLSAADITMSFGPQTVLDGVSLTVDNGTRAGLVGANGSGKSTLLRILSGDETAESGTVTAARNTIVEYLPQRNTVPQETTVFEYAEEGYAREHRLFESRSITANRLVNDPDNQADLQFVADADHSLEETGYYRREEHIGRVLHGLGFVPTDFSRPLHEFSGGWRMRASLAKSLLTRPDVLLLDEPTNYLDSEARIWLSGFLRTFTGGFVIVSHDRAFLDESVDTVLELFHGKVKRFRGSYTTYETKRREELKQLVAAWETQQKQIAKQEDFIRRFRANANKAKQVQSRIKVLDKLEPIEIPDHLRPVSITLPPPIHSGRTVLTLTEVHKYYGNLHVLDDISLTLTRGQRLAVVGLNGAGKSTLLRLLSGSEKQDSGDIRTGTGVEIAYFAQDSADHLPEDQTILDYVTGRATNAAIPRVRDILGSFLFSGDSVNKPIAVLSGGERSRVAMAALLVRPANLLIMDEPTNHLDMTSQEVLSRALSQYEGTVIVVSHDRHFLREVATDVLALWPAGSTGEAIPPHRRQLYPGSYGEFESARLGQVFLIDGGIKVGEDRSEKEQDGDGSLTDYEAQKQLRSDLKRLDRREQEILAEIDELETEHTQIQENLSLPENYLDGTKVQSLQKKLSINEQRHHTLHQEWERLEGERQKLSGQ